MDVNKAKKDIDDWFDRHTGEELEAKWEKYNKRRGQKEMEESKEFKRGYRGAKESLNRKYEPKKLLNQVYSSLTYDDFDRGWEKACKEELE